MSMCRCAPRRLRVSQELAQPRRGVALTALGGLGAQQRGERRDLHGEVRPRDRAGAVALERRLVADALVDGRQRVERVRAARRVAIGLGGRDGRLAEQVDRGRDPVVPEAAERRDRGGGILADDEAVGHVPDPGGAGGAERRAPGLRVAHPHRRPQRRRAPVDLLEVAGQVGGEVVERAAGGHDVDEAKERRAQLGVLGGELHRAVVERLERVAAMGWERPGQRAPRALDLALERVGVSHA